jgi:hypothetical protein
MMTPTGKDRVAAELDARILRIIEAWQNGGEGLDDEAFGALALHLFSYQVAHNEPYRRFLSAVRGTVELPRHWRGIPAVPASAFKDTKLATFDVREAELEFHTSGTTAGRAGRHYFERAALYEAALMAAFDAFMLADKARLGYLLLLAEPGEQPHSSLAHMMRVVGQRRGIEAPTFYVTGGTLDVETLRNDLARSVALQTPVCIAGTAFALVALIDALGETGTSFSCPAGSRIMETGGFKGRSRIVDRTALYRSLSRCLGVPEHAIVAEYGMTELASQYYDSPRSRHQTTRVKAGPPWLRTLVVDAEGREVPDGAIGFLRHVDLANRSSVICVQTEDRGYTVPGGFVLLGRSEDALPRGCSLDAEELAARSR